LRHLPSQWVVSERGRATPTLFKIVVSTLLRRFTVPCSMFNINFTWVNPRLCRGIPEFDNYGNIRKPPFCEPLKVYRKESFRMEEYQSLSHTVWDCKYHAVWIPKYRRKTLYEQLRKHLGQVFRELAMQRESRILEGHLVVDHVHMLICIPPKYSVAQVVGFIKGKSAINIPRSFLGKKKNFTGFFIKPFTISKSQTNKARLMDSFCLTGILLLRFLPGYKIPPGMKHPLRASPRLRITRYGEDFQPG
jgi:putative transposase